MEEDFISIENEDDDIENTIGRYEGERNENQERHGFGWALLPNGDQYEGLYKHGLRCGNGLYVFKNGARYLGEWVRGLKSGIGKFYYPDGSTYDGEWKGDLKHGHGLYIYRNGDKYDGNWMNGRKHGVGVYLFAESGAKFIGTWREDGRIGPCEIILNNTRYHGHWNGNNANGPGIFSFDCKYMTDGYMDEIITSTVINHEENNPRESQGSLIKNHSNRTSKSFKFKKDQVVNDREVVWKCIKSSKFDYSKLPLEPIPLPRDESDFSECEITPVLSEKDMESVNSHCEDEELMEEEGEIEVDDDQIEESTTIKN